MTDRLKTDAEQIVARYPQSRSALLPMSNSASFIFSLSKKQKVSLKVYDVRGKLVKELVNEVRTIGDHIVKLNAAELSEGTYHYQFRTEERMQDGSVIIQR